MRVDRDRITSLASLNTLCLCLCLWAVWARALIAGPYDRIFFFLSAILNNGQMPVSLLVSPCLIDSRFPFSPRLLIHLCIPWLETLHSLSLLSSSSVLDSYHHCSAHLCTLSHYAALTILLACVPCRTYACPSCCVTYRANATDIERVKHKAKFR
jgi:hypothetical protein